MAVRTMIEVLGAKQNNLKNVSLEIPRDKLVVITGVSGSGKSSLAFDVIYGEAQRRFLDSISNFAKSRISQVKKPKVDFVRGLSPVIAIEQKKGNSNPRSTVGTVTDINDYLRLLFSTVGVGKCPVCGHPLRQVTSAQMAEHVSSLPEGTVVEMRAPLYKVYGEGYAFILKKTRERGYRRLLVDGEPFDLSDKAELDDSKDHRIEIVIDRFTIKPNVYMQITKSIEAATVSLSEELFVRFEVVGGGQDESFYDGFACPEHHYTLCEMQPFHFSFNSPASACDTCMGIGRTYVVEPRFLVVAPERSILRGALINTLFNPAGKDSYRTAIVYSLSQKYGFSLETPFNELPKEAHDLLFYGTKGEKVTMVQPPFATRRNWIVGREFPFGGFVNDLGHWYRNYVRKSISTEMFEPGFIKETMVERVCPDCGGGRLKRQRLNVTVNGRNIEDLCRMQFGELIGFLSGVGFPEEHREIGASIISEIKSRMQLLVDIGLYYLNLGRRSDTISGGEMQRIKMSTQISSELMGMLYVMDEPSIGLHPRDSGKVIDIMKRLRDIGNTVIVVEHDTETMKNADFLVEVGEGPGIHGGNVVAKGTYEEFLGQPSVTSDYLLGRRAIGVPGRRAANLDDCITIQGARENNLKNITVELPLRLFICVTGVSGSGKSTLINEILFKQLEIAKKSARIVAGEHDHVLGYEGVNQIINIDQSPIGRNSKSNPATYVGVYDRIRDLFAETELAVKRGFRALDFSLTHANGARCENCTGDGVIVTSLQFMADIETVCPVCKGAKFSEEGLEIKYEGKNVSEVLDMTVEEAAAFFEGNRYIRHKLTIMSDLGLGYMKMGQSSTTLSGGEAQRVKLAYELAKIKRGSHNVYILDEPTTGLHLYDIQKLLLSLNRLVEGGHTVIVIEHNLDVIKSADYIIDMGPEGGNSGGYVVVAGTPEEVAECGASHTGAFLRGVLGEGAGTRGEGAGLTEADPWAKGGSGAGLTEVDPWAKGGSGAKAGAGTPGKGSEPPKAAAFVGATGAPKRKRGRPPKVRPVE
ncbi:MAG: excinuclease ABC subunit UvrA [Oscillospiraceae bacterium]|nr:excinuclease ABC subunit UvrA [Oscillospiraceae bacterium]